MALIGSLLRVVIAVVIGLLMLVGFGILLLRQPSFGRVGFGEGSRADAGRLRDHVELLAGPAPARNHNHPERLRETVRYLREQLSVPGATIVERPYLAQVSGTRESRQTNVIARFGPDSGPLTVVGAHYDVFGDLPGADDNASGVAGLLELARLLSLRDPQGRIELVAYGTEEPPFFGSTQMGSAIHARDLADQRVAVRAMICLEMIGYFVERQPYPSWLLRLAYPSHGRFIAIVGRWQDRDVARRVKRCFRGAAELQAVSYSGPRLFGADLSDHRNYWNHGYPAVMVTDTAFLRNPNYHNADDTPDTLDYGRMAEVVDGVLNAVLDLSRDD
jgi:hypothetical protein